MKSLIRSFLILAGFFLVALVAHAQEGPDLASQARDILAAAHPFFWGLFR